VSDFNRAITYSESTSGSASELGVRKNFVHRGEEG
jgi:hypothetical protein